MKDAIQNLPDDPQLLKKLLLEKEAVIASMDAKIQSLIEQYRLSQHRQFGRSSETNPNQGELFDEAESIVVEVEDNQSSTTGSESKSAKRVRQPLPADLPRTTQVIDIKDDEKSCDCCGGELHQMGEDVSEKLEFIPAQIQVIRTVRPKYSCRQCEQQGTQVAIKQAKVPHSPIPKGIATPSLLSQIITSKYQYGLPLYRQESLFKQYGIALNRQTMAQWMMRCATLFKPIIERLHELILVQAVIQADETTVNVLNENKTNSYMWVYCTGSDAPVESDVPNIVLFDYQNSRAGQCPKDFLQSYTGYLQVDGYQGYEQTEATLVGCMAHARRKFHEAQKAMPKGKVGRAGWALNQIKKLYQIEAHIKDKPIAYKQEIRQQKSVPLLNQFKEWLEKSALQVPPKSTLGKAIQYSLNQWHKLIRYTEDGRLNIDNNRCERAIKPFVIGRKNWLFSNTAKGASASAVLYSLIETAKANGLTPFDYLMHLLQHLKSSSSKEEIERLLPWNVSVSNNDS